MEAVILAFVLAVTDGDSIKARLELYPHLSLEANIRLLGIDTPELRGKCAKEKALALQAKAALQELLPIGSVIFVRHMTADKYGSRLDAEVRNTDGVDVGAELLKRGLAHVFSGKGVRPSWCTTQMERGAP